MDKSKMAEPGTVIKYDMLKEDYRNEDMSRPVEQRRMHSWCGCMCAPGKSCDCEKPIQSIDEALGIKEVT